MFIPQAAPLPRKKQYIREMTTLTINPHHHHHHQQHLDQPQDFTMKTLNKLEGLLRNQRRMRAHLRRQAIRESGRYTCETCNRSFVQLSSLNTHRRIHTGERPYTCNKCFKLFSDLSTFTKHKRTHTGEKPYKCRHCGRGFSQSGNCLRHKRSIHGDHGPSSSDGGNSPSSVDSDCLDEQEEEDEQQSMDSPTSSASASTSPSLSSSHLNDTPN